MLRFMLVPIFSMLAILPSITSAITIAPDHNDLHIVLIGPPASGKGTLAEFLSAHYHIPTVSTGNLLRTEAVNQSALGKQIQEIMTKGGLVPTSLVIQVLKKRISAADADKGFILDGFPRNTEQSSLLDSTGISIDFVIVLKLSPEAAVDRISYRRVHLPSGRSYHLKTNPPKRAGVDDITNEALIQREDDTKSAITNRLQAFEDQTKPVIEWYKEKQKDPNNALKVIEIDASLSIEEIQKAALKAMAPAEKMVNDKGKKESSALIPTTTPTLSPKAETTPDVKSKAK